MAAAYVCSMRAALTTNTNIHIIPEEMLVAHSII